MKAKTIVLFVLLAFLVQAIVVGTLVYVNRDALFRYNPGEAINILYESYGESEIYYTDSDEEIYGVHTDRDFVTILHDAETFMIVSGYKDNFSLLMFSYNESLIRKRVTIFFEEAIIATSEGQGLSVIAYGRNHWSTPDPGFKTDYTIDELLEILHDLSPRDVYWLAGKLE